MFQFAHSQKDWFLTRRRMLSGASSASVACLVGSVLYAKDAHAQSQSAGASALAQSSHSMVRLVAGGAAEGAFGTYHAGFVMALHPGFKTYWRHPGDSGVPPVFTFEGSKNLAKAEVFYPSPKRFSDGAGGHSFGYLGPEVVLPVMVHALDPAKPILLHIRMDYAVCETICIPSGGDLFLAISGSDDKGMTAARHMGLLAEARARLPVRLALRQGDGLKILAVEKAAQPEHFNVVVALPENSKTNGAAPELFVEGESPWFFDVKDMTHRSASEAVFLVAVIERSKAVDCTGAEIVMTLVGDKQSIEVPTRIDLALVTH